MHQAKQDAPLAVSGRKPIEPGQMTTTGGGQHRLGRPPDQPTLSHPSLDAVPVHALPKSVISDAALAFAKRV
jgi:hypothetical protein